MQSLAEWIHFLDNLPGVDIHLSLERANEALRRLEISFGGASVVTVAGTNGKGSTVVGLESIYTTAGYLTGSFTSPYLFQFTDQIKLNGISITEMDLVAAYTQVHALCHDLHLTKFEYTTIAALTYFNALQLDILLLEVGLGGRFDAVNAISADVAIITSIGLDHTEWLGNTREKIGFEKAGIFRTGAYAISGDSDTPKSILAEAKQKQIDLWMIHKQFFYSETGATWEWHSGDLAYIALPKPNLLLSNMSCVLMCVTLLQAKYPVTAKQLHRGLQALQLAGRLEWVPGKPNKLFDVGHNPDAAQQLLSFLQKRKISKVRAVFSMLKEKDMRSTLKVLKDIVQYWYVAELDTPRKTSLAKMQLAFAQTQISSVNFFTNIKTAYTTAIHDTRDDEVLIIFGSFLTVSATYTIAADDVKKQP